MLLNTFELLPRKDIKTVRLVCRHWAALSTPLLIDRVFFAPRRKIMEYFTSVSKHPVFSKTVKEIFYDATLHDERMMEPERYKLAYKLKYHDFDEAAYQRGLDQCRKMLVDQQAILDNKEDVAVIKAGLDLMPKVKRVSIFDSSKDSCVRPWYDDEGPGSWDGSLPNYPPIWTSYEKDSEQDGSSETYGNGWDPRIFNNLFCAISLSDTTIYDLVLGAKQQKDLCTVPFTLCQFRRDELLHACNVFWPLTKLSIRFNTDDSGLEDIRWLVDWLKEARSLTDLTLEFLPTLYEDVFHYLWQMSPWPNLRSLEISHMWCDQDGLAGFLRSHTLEMVCVKAIHLLAPGSWEEVAENLSFDKASLSYLGAEDNGGFYTLSNEEHTKLERCMLRSKPAEKATVW